MATNPRNLINLENGVTNYLGKISYGLYMYHPLVIIFVINTSLYFNIFNGILLYASSILLVILLSHFSFYYFESYFSRLRAKLIKPDTVAQRKNAAVISEAIS